MNKPIEIISSVYFLSGLKPTAHSYLLTGQKNVLVDVGTRESYSYLVDQLHQCGYSVSDIHQVVFTHAHYDHVGAGEFFSHAEIFAHPLCFAKILYQEEETIHAVRNHARLPLGVPTTLLSDGQELLLGDWVWKVLFTPGHSDDGICLYEKIHGILISGDTVFASGIPPFIIESGSDASLLYSISKIQSYTVKMILPGHGRIEFKAEETLKKTQIQILKRIQQNNQRYDEGDKKWKYQNFS